jgi:hypothetical protein
MMLLRRKVSKLAGRKTRLFSGIETYFVWGLENGQGFARERISAIQESRAAIAHEIEGDISDVCQARRLAEV